MVIQYALIDQTGLIVNICLWDGKTKWAPPAGQTPIPDPNDEAIIGGTYHDGQFFPPS